MSHSAKPRPESESLSLSNSIEIIVMKFPPFWKPNRNENFPHDVNEWWFVITVLWHKHCGHPSEWRREIGQDLVSFVCLPVLMNYVRWCKPQRQLPREFLFVLEAHSGGQKYHRIHDFIFAKCRNSASSSKWWWANLNNLAFSKWCTSPHPRHDWTLSTLSWRQSFFMCASQLNVKWFMVALLAHATVGHNGWVCCFSRLIFQSVVFCAFWGESVRIQIKSFFRNSQR